MKYYIFVDNFRGFSDTCIPISDVNFLVGENSTGKTSILGLLKLISDPEFLFTLEFAHEHVGFRHFSDMVSAHSGNKSYFRVGFAWEKLHKSGRKTETIVHGSLFTFVEDEGLPRLLKYTFCRGEQKVSLRLGDKDIYYKAAKCKFSTAQSLISVLRTEWVREHKADSGYVKLVLPPSLPTGRIPILFAVGFIMPNVSRQKGKKRELEFSPPDIDVPPQLIWLAPIRTKPQRTYDELPREYSPEGVHTPEVIRKMLRSKTQAAKFRSFIERVGKASHLFQDVRVKNFGRGATAPFELDIVLDGKALQIINVGYGVSQSLPVFVELLVRASGTWFAIQQPEVHLHPRAQATLGDTFFEMAAIDHKKFLIETHSDFMIDRFRMNYATKRPDKPDSQILFFERREKHNVVTALPISQSGELPKDQPDAYREFFIREELRLLQL